MTKPAATSMTDEMAQRSALTLIWSLVVTQLHDPGWIKSRQLIAAAMVCHRARLYMNREKA